MNRVTDERVFTGIGVFSGVMLWFCSSMQNSTEKFPEGGWSIVGQL